MRGIILYLSCNPLATLSIMSSSVIHVVALHSRFFFLFETCNCQFMIFLPSLHSARIIVVWYSVCLCPHPSVPLGIYLSVCYPSSCLSSCLSVCLSTTLPAVCLSVWLSIHLSVPLAVNLSACLPDWLTAYLSLMLRMKSRTSSVLNMYFITACSQAFNIFERYWNAWSYYETCLMMLHNIFKVRGWFCWFSSSPSNPPVLFGTLLPSQL